ncbi:MAG: glucose-6-phosphate isomerase [Alcanivorax sp.]|jgi:glucose-6-phosphate isomerase|uniref:glucose-6-phosphate isomerase n=1 Tax=Alcanivorax TaxID=59753 RepID=UPI000C8A1857|nr:MULTISPECIES: glucose-6-phosphate isomerase [Alcanivorax]MAC13207.1 glucose-6-phosphate isomerase [Alcanivorax sp.]MDF1638704.1 glucose-6-phosphate isomerase [Alcanivorax jadensis]|tara:strand:- start:330 stop:1973 length:1644 start_codon:yes stop_codon:yes gene_type:complete
MVPEQDVLTISTIWSQLAERAGQEKTLHLADRFAADQTRFERFSLNACGVLADFSKQRMSDESRDLLVKLADERQLRHWLDALFSGADVNCTEGRAAKHWCLREPAELAPQVHEQLDAMEGMVERILKGHWRGVLGDAITDVVNVGVGGSDLGPLMAAFALQSSLPPTGQTRPRIHFASSMDGSQVSQVLQELNPRTTLFLVSSKSFTTVDTLHNAKTARQWLARGLGLDFDNASLLRCHFIGISANAERMSTWGITPYNQLQFWDWVGGRYSLWSAIGLPIALTVGMEGFRELLAGAHDMDQHCRTQPWQDNLPVMLALVDVWNINFMKISARAVLPYDGRLKHLPAYLEQLEMESNGKSVSRAGEPVEYDTCPVIWGEVGPNAQHAFFQLLHQGTQPIACEFLMTARRYTEDMHSEAAAELDAQHALSNANCLAQSRLLALGERALDLKVALPPYKRYHGNQPSTTLVLEELSPRVLGALLAMYEHKVFVQAVIWGINPFDQWGVEMGKMIATDMLAVLADPESASGLDASSMALARHIGSFKDS